MVDLRLQSFPSVHTHHLLSFSVFPCKLLNWVKIFKLSAPIKEEKSQSLERKERNYREGATLRNWNYFMSISQCLGLILLRQA